MSMSRESRHKASHELIISTITVADIVTCHLPNCLAGPTPQCHLVTVTSHTV